MILHGYTSRALASKSIKNERIFAFAAPFTLNQVLGILTTKNPGRDFPADKPDAEMSRLSVPNQR